MEELHLPAELLVFGEQKPVLMEPCVAEVRLHTCTCGSSARGVCLCNHFVPPSSDWLLLLLLLLCTPTLLNTHVSHVLLLTSHLCPPFASHHFTSQHVVFLL